MAARQQPRVPLKKARRAEANYMRQLRKVANQITEIVRTLRPKNPRDTLRLQTTLRKYSEVVRPWAESVGQKMLAEAAIEERRGWRQYTEQMGAALRQELDKAPTGEVMREQLAAQVELITSLPTEAAQRVSELSQRALVTGAREDEVLELIMKTGEVTAARARTIARTEVGRAQTALTKARAEFVGSEGYIWRTAQDVDVRDSHRKMNGKFVRWDSPPTLDGMVGHAGALPNCRCYPEVVVPEIDE